MFSVYQWGQLKITSLIRLGLLEWLETPLIIKAARATILYVQPEMKFRSPPGHFHHEPPLVTSTCYRGSRGLSSQTRNSCQWPVFWSKLVACPGESLTLDPANLACPNWPPRHWDWYCQKTDVLFSPSWNLAMPLAPRIDIVKRQFIVLLDSEAPPCYPCLKTWCWQSYSLSPCLRIWHFL